MVSIFFHQDRYIQTDMNNMRRIIIAVCLVMGIMAVANDTIMASTRVLALLLAIITVIRSKAST